MTSDAIDIREFAEAGLETIVAFSLRAWEPVFASLQAVLGDEIFLRLHPDWRTSQAETVRSISTNNERDVYVAVVGARPVGFVAVALDAFHERMGIIEIIGVDPDYQRRGVGARLTEFAADHMRRCGMDIAVSRPAATQGTHRLVRCTAKWASRSCRSPVTSGCSTDVTTASECVKRHSRTLAQSRGLSPGRVRRHPWRLSEVCQSEQQRRGAMVLGRRSARGRSQSRDTGSGTDGRVRDVAQQTRASLRPPVPRSVRSSPRRP